jgi:hypothetical protein
VPKHRPTHAKSGLGRYTAPRRLHAAHAAPTTGGVRIARLAGTVIGGGVLAGAGLMGLISVPSGAASLGPETSPPFSSLGVTMTDPDGSTATLAGGGNEGAEAIAAAGIGSNANLDDNTAFSDSFGVDTIAESDAGVGTHADVSDNLASSTALGVDGVASTDAGIVTDGIGSGNSATAWTFSGSSSADASLGTDARDADDIAWAGSQIGGDATAVAGIVSHGDGSNDQAYAYAIGPVTASAEAGNGDGHQTNDLAVANGAFGDAVAEVESANASSASAGAAGGGAIVIVGNGTGSRAAGTAAGAGADADASDDGSGDTASASAIGTGTEAESLVVGTGQSADTAADGTDSTALAEVAPGVSEVEASTGLGGAAFASNSGGIWTVSLNGATLIG